MSTGGRDDGSIEVGRVEAIFRYPVKSMGGQALDAAALGWHGVDGDRRLAVRRVDERGDFPWLTASRLPDLVRFMPLASADAAAGGVHPTHIRTPEGEELDALGEALAADIARRHRAPVEMMRMKHGVFDDASVSIIGVETVAEIGRVAGLDADVRRFRPNIVVRLTREAPFAEDAWVGGVVTFGDGGEAPAVTVTARDVRCAMVNIDPDTGALTPAVLKAVVQANDNQAGVYGTVTRTGRVAVGQAVRLRR
jgi:uncharacterized protein YcbX